jgi:glucan phosphoethanolaminetransferase (alkaline phosphatase superfamily)
LGLIVYKTLIKLLLIIVLFSFLRDYFDVRFFWIVSILAIFLFVIHPAYMAYRNFIMENQNIVDNTLCSSCKHFDKSSVLCMKYDKHPTENFIPCEGTDWEPK